MKDQERFDELMLLMVKAWNRGDMAEVERLRPEASAIVHGPEMNAQVARMLISAAQHVMTHMVTVPIAEVNAMRAQIRELKANQKRKR